MKLYKNNISQDDFKDLLEKILKAKKAKEKGLYSSIKIYNLLENYCESIAIIEKNRTGSWNGYGYNKLKNRIYIKSFTKLINLVKKYILETEGRAKPKPKKNNFLVWVERLVKLTNISIEEATELAEAKEDAKQYQIEELEERQKYKYSVKRNQLIQKLIRSNPLRRIRDIEHANCILEASNRHNNTSYDRILEDKRDDVKAGFMTSEEARDEARKEAKF